jgi:hypothetical protein
MPEGVDQRLRPGSSLIVNVEPAGDVSANEPLFLESAEPMANVSPAPTPEVITTPFPAYSSLLPPIDRTKSGEEFYADLQAKRIIPGYDQDRFSCWCHVAKSEEDPEAEGLSVSHCDATRKSTAGKVPRYLPSRWFSHASKCPFYKVSFWVGATSAAEPYCRIPGQPQDRMGLATDCFPSFHYENRKSEKLRLKTAMGDLRLLQCDEAERGGRYRIASGEHPWLRTTINLRVVPSSRNASKTGLAKMKICRSVEGSSISGRYSGADSPRTERNAGRRSHGRGVATHRRHDCRICTYTGNSTTP